MKEMQQTMDMLTRQNEEQQQKLQDMEESKLNNNEEAEQLRDELVQAQNKLKLRSGQCLLKEGQKQKVGMTYEAQLLEMQSMLETLKHSEMAMKQDRKSQRMKTMQ